MMNLVDVDVGNYNGLIRIYFGGIYGLCYKNVP